VPNPETYEQETTLDKWIAFAEGATELVGAVGGVLGRNREEPAPAPSGPTSPEEVTWGSTAGATQERAEPGYMGELLRKQREEQAAASGKTAMIAAVGGLVLIVAIGAGGLAIYSYSKGRA
jgi:hypothetical protein